MQKAASLALVALTLSACTGGDGEPDVAPGGPSSERVTLRPLGSVDGARNGYVEYAPPGYGDGKRRPLLVYLHGAGDNGGGSEDELEQVASGGIPGLITADRWPEARPFVSSRRSTRAATSRARCALTRARSTRSSGSRSRATPSTAGAST